MTELKTTTPINPSLSGSSAENNLEDSELALQGITLLLNNGWDEAKELFAKHKENSALMHSGDSLVQFIQAMMTFEEEKLAEAHKALQESEKRCENPNGFILTMKRRLTKKKSQSSTHVETTEEKLERLTIVADSILCQAFLTFVNMDIKSYIKGGWLLRRAWKVYEKTYSLATNFYESSRKDKPKSSASQEIEGVATCEEAVDATDMNTAVIDTSSNDSASQLSADSYAEITSARLLGAVSFGYGLIQLAFSLMPPKLLKLIEFLGFAGDKQVGLSALEFSSHSKDMKAPLSALALLAFHVVMRPLFALDGVSVDAGVADALVIMDRCERIYTKSSLFLYFKGRIARLQARIPDSISIFETAMNECIGQREIELVCLHELVWCNMMQLDWSKASDRAKRLKDDSKWSKSFYAYLLGVIKGVLGEKDSQVREFKEVPSLIKRKNAQIEAFVLQRIEKAKKSPLSADDCRFMVFEILYLWNSLPTCEPSVLNQILQFCDSFQNKKLFHLRCLIEGATHKTLRSVDMAAQCFEEAIAQHKGMKDDYHIPSYAMYELGTILIEDPKTHKKGIEYLNLAKDSHKDYCFENRLNVRIHAALKTAKSEGTPI